MHVVFFRSNVKSTPSSMQFSTATTTKIAIWLSMTCSLWWTDYSIIAMSSTRRHKYTHKSTTAIEATDWPQPMQIPNCQFIHSCNFCVCSSNAFVQINNHHFCIISSIIIGWPLCAVTIYAVLNLKTKHTVIKFLKTQFINTQNLLEYSGKITSIKKRKANTHTH